MTQLNAVPTNPQNNEPTLDQLCAILVAEKARLAIQQRNVREAEDALIAHVGSRDEGSFSVTSERYKVTTTQPVRRTVEPKLARDVMRELPADIADAIFTWKPELSLRVYRELEKYRPELHDAVSRAVTSKPGKVSVKVEEVDQ